MGRFISKKILVIGAGALILLAGIGMGLTFGETSPSVSPPPIVNNLSAQDKIAQETNRQNQFSDDTFKVTRVIDGDTIEIESGERIRYIGIDTPETVDPRKSVQCFGVEASNKNKELVLGKMVRIKGVSHLLCCGKIQRCHALSVLMKEDTYTTY